MRNCQIKSWLIHYTAIESCILLNFYIKPQLTVKRILNFGVVSYWISTSNHNRVVRRPIGGTVVSYWISTSNHNRGR